ncbi:hypothetical protein CAEBREN_14502 [Caenorhabditis brenneri]|uniref:Carboxylic ester hydrolase n=1 Tax=Caenorhabditis brenneri TaxID=135651 RepID=G0NEN0_CAEBE|nr:hypothetical protein CAEBREN_14502 [Caenorhabditis brenneri]
MEIRSTFLTIFIIFVLTISFTLLISMGGFLSHLEPVNNLAVLNATCGPIRGNIYKHNGKIVDGYLGIPFAKAPVGELKFKKPVAAEKWEEPIDCFKYGPACPQSGYFGKTMIPKDFHVGEDNCLTLNVFAPRWRSEELPKGLPVMVYFYGGGFEIGSSSFYHDYSLSGTLPLKDVVLVTANYRVGPLGFLTTGDNVAKGNYGLWDQTLALKWVQEHIQSFGGDPDNVTIFGTSAGGASVDMLALSPHSNNSESLLSWYMAQDPSKFLDVEGFERPASGFLSFVANMDGDFFPKPFDELRREAPKIDVMAQVGEYEGLGYELYFPKNVSPEEIFSLVYGSDIVGDNSEVAMDVMNAYMEGVDKSNQTDVVKKLVEFIGDVWFNHGPFDSARSCTKYGNNAYLSSFDYFSKESNNSWLDWLPFKAASHGTDLKYILGIDGVSNFTPSEEELKVMDMMATFVSNFAKYGNPNGRNQPEVWKKYNLDQPEQYFKIDYPKCEMRDHFQNGRLKVIDEANKKNKKYQEIIYGKKI